MTLKQIKNCSLKELQEAVKKNNGSEENYKDKNNCVRYLRSKKITFIDDNTQPKKNIKPIEHFNIGHIQPVSVPQETITFNKTHCDNPVSNVDNPTYNPIQSDAVNRRVPFANSQDGLFGRLLVTKHLDVYHDIYYGPNKTRVSSKISEIETFLQQLQFTPISGHNGFVDSTVEYTPTISFLNDDDSAHIDSNYTHYILQIQYLTRLTDLKLDFRVYSINLSEDSEHQVYINLPYEVDMNYYTNDSKTPIPDVLIKYEYNSLLNDYKYQSKMSSAYVDKTNPTRLILKSGLFQHHHESNFVDYNLANSQFNVEIHFRYVATSVGISPCDHD